MEQIKVTKGLDSYRAEPRFSGADVTSELLASLRGKAVVAEIQILSHVERFVGVLADLDEKGATFQWRFGQTSTAGVSELPLGDIFWIGPAVPVSGADDDDEANHRLSAEEVEQQLDVARRTLFYFRPPELPDALRASLPVDAGPNGCLFLIGRHDNVVTKALFEQLVEPEIDHVNEGVQLADDIVKVVQSNPVLRRILRPESSLDVGFHSAPADEVDAWLRKQDVTLLPISMLLAEH